MAITAEQKADVGQRFLDTIKERIATRTKAHKDVTEKARKIMSTDEDDDEEGEGSLAIRALARQWCEEHGLKGKVLSTRFDSERVGGEYQPVLEIYHVDATIHVAITKLPAVRAARDEHRKHEKLAQDLCQEISFLHEIVNSVAAFQAHVGRLWAPAGKSVTLTESRFKELLDDFLLSKRPAVCAR